MRTILTYINANVNRLIGLTIGSINPSGRRG